MADVPHFALPFRFDGNPTRAAVVEQGSTEDVAVCVEAIVRYRRGQRDIAPHFGIEDPTFSQGGVDGASLLTAIEEQEPRAQPALTRVEDDLDRARSLAEGVDIVRISLGITDFG